MSNAGEMNDFNKQIIDEFRANDGVVSGPFEGAPVLILHSKGAETRSVRARIADGSERDGIWERHKSAWPQFAEYERNTDRTIPVVVLETA